MTNTIVLYTESGEPWGVTCGKCIAFVSRLATFGGGPMALESALEAAKSCCGPRTCSECGNSMSGSWCQPCRYAKELSRSQAAYEKATKVTLAEYTGLMVATDDTDGSVVDADGALDLPNGDVFFAADGTRFVWGASPDTPTVDLEHELENWLQEHHEEAESQVDHVLLRKAEALVNQALSGVESYYEDRSVAVILPPAEEETE